MIGISEDSVTQISNNSQKKIQRLLEKTDKYDNSKISKKIKKKNINRCNQKISHLVDDLHWKSIKYLTDNHENVLIGDIETKGAVSNKRSVLRPMTKRIMYKLSFFKFKQRLEYKCFVTNTGFKKIEESFTSKVCSNCSYYKKNLGKSEIFSCDICKTVIDRDINGARGIFFKVQ